MNMEFGVINIANAVILGLIMIPNIVYAIRGGTDSTSDNPIVTILEQVGRYASMVLMVLPLGVWKFGFPSVGEFLAYLFGNGMLVLLYLVTWIFYSRKKNYTETLILAITPVLIFVLTGICLRHWLLVAAATMFGICHISISIRARK